jgi:hypothetical protein
MPGMPQPLTDQANPLDRVERLAELRQWQVDRPSDDEVMMTISGGWCDLHLSLSWRDDIEALIVATSFDLRVPDRRRDEILKLLAAINVQMVHGHFDFWPVDGVIIFRDSLILSGGAEANDAQCESMIRSGIESCQRYYPAVQFVIWAGHTAEEAMNSALLETHGEA